MPKHSYKRIPLDIYINKRTYLDLFRPFPPLIATRGGAPTYSPSKLDPLSPPIPICARGVWVKSGEKGVMLRKSLKSAT